VQFSEWFEDLRDGGHQAFVRVQNHKLHALQPALFEPAKEAVPGDGTSEEPSPSHRISLRPSILTPVAIIEATAAHAPIVWCFQIGGLQPDIGLFAIDWPAEDGIEAL